MTQPKKCRLLDPEQFVEECWRQLQSWEVISLLNHHLLIVSVAQVSECLPLKGVFFRLNVVIRVNGNILRGNVLLSWVSPIRIRTSISGLSLLTFRDRDFEVQKANKMKPLSLRYLNREI